MTITNAHVGASFVVIFALALTLAGGGALASCTTDVAAPQAAGDAGTRDADVPPTSGDDHDDGGDAATDAEVSPDANPPDRGSYTNPVFVGDFPDPFILRDGSTYYAFATNVGGNNVRAATSNDLATWTELPDALPTLPSWAQAGASLTWAPSVLRRGTTFVLYYTARSTADGVQCLGRAVATNPAGPYVDESATPFICQVALCGSIDASPFVDPNGDAYLLWKSDENAAACSSDSRLWTQRLGVDGLSLLGAPAELLKRDRSWELPLIEGPSMIEDHGQYYLFYSANRWESPSYGIGYAVCASAHGPCTKMTPDGPLVGSRGDALGPGGQELFTDEQSRRWMAYHAWSSPIVGYANGGSRSLRIDPLVIAGGVPALLGPTTTPSPL